MPGRRGRPVGIIITFTRLAPGSSEEQDAIRKARAIWLEGQLEARGKEIESRQTSRPARHQPVPKRDLG